MSDRIAVMNEGIIEQIGTPEEIYEKPATKFVATFIGETNLFEGYIKEIENETVRIAIESGMVLGSGTGFKENEMVAVSVRPERLKYSEEPVPGFTIEGMVKEQIYIGAPQKTIIILSNGNEVRIERLSGQKLPANGKVYLHWEAADARIIHSRDQIIFDAVENMQLA